MRRRMDVFSGSKGYLPLGSHYRTSQEVPPICMGRHHLQIQLSTIWSLQCSEDLYKAPLPCDGTLTIYGSETGNLLGRHPANGRSGDSAETSPTDHHPTGTTGLHCEQAEVNPRPLPSDHLPGTPSRHYLNETTLTREKMQQIINDCRQMLAKGTIAAQELASVIGRMSAARLAGLPAPLYTRHLQHQLIQTQKRSLSLRTKVTLNQDSLTKVHRWIDHLRQWNGRGIVSPLQI